MTDKIQLTLKEFVSKALIEISGGVISANQQHPESRPFKISQSLFSGGGKPISFDVAVIADENTSKQAGLKVAGVIIGGKASGSQESGETITHRIKFDINLHEDIL